MQKYYNNITDTLLVNISLANNRLDEILMTVTILKLIKVLSAGLNLLTIASFIFHIQSRNSLTGDMVLMLNKCFMYQLKRVFSDM